MAAQVTKIGPLGPYDNNAYIVTDPTTRHALVVDAPIGSERVVAAAEGLAVRMVVVTHRHGDHWANIDLVRDRIGAPVCCHADDREPYRSKVSDTVADGAVLRIGEVDVNVIHTPGHTPGSICLFLETSAGPALISGDTLFPGGPGRSDSPAALQQMIASITARLLVLPEETHVYPGHGADTTIADARREYAAFASRPHAADLCGDVLWDAP